MEREDPETSPCGKEQKQPNSNDSRYDWEIQQRDRHISEFFMTLIPLPSAALKGLRYS
jgi:hypothetical protein